MVLFDLVRPGEHSAASRCPGEDTTADDAREAPAIRERLRVELLKLLPEP